jgi:hypothetical protein
VRIAALGLILICVSHFGVLDGAVAETVDEVLAVVGRTPLLVSDVRLAELVQLLEREPDEPEELYRSRLIDARIRLELEFRDLEESGLLFRLEVDSARARDALVARAGGEQALEQQLEASGLTSADLDELALRLAAVDAFVEQRLRSRVSVTAEEIEAAYQQLIVDRIATAGEPPPTIAEVRDELATIVAERKLNAEIERWLERAASRQEVTRFSR